MPMKMVTVSAVFRSKRRAIAPKTVAYIASVIPRSTRLPPFGRNGLRAGASSVCGTQEKAVLDHDGLRAAHRFVGGDGVP